MQPVCCKRCGCVMNSVCVSFVVQTSAAYVLFYQRKDKIRKPTLPTPNTSSAPTAQLANDITSCRDGDTEAGAAAASYITMETD